MPANPEFSPRDPSLLRRLLAALKNARGKKEHEQPVQSVAQEVPTETKRVEASSPTAVLQGKKDIVHQIQALADWKENPQVQQVFQQVSDVLTKSLSADSFAQLSKCQVALADAPYGSTYSSIVYETQRALADRWLLRDPKAAFMALGNYLDTVATPSLLQSRRNELQREEAEQTTETAQVPGGAGFAPALATAQQILNGEVEASEPQIQVAFEGLQKLDREAPIKVAAEKLDEVRKDIREKMNQLADLLPGKKPDKLVSITAHEDIPDVFPAGHPRAGTVINYEDNNIYGNTDLARDVFEIFKKEVDKDYTQPSTLYRIFEGNRAKYLQHPLNHKGRDYIFHKVIDKVLTQRNKTAQELYDLYERQDMNSFLRFVKQIEVHPGTGDALDYTAPGELASRKLGNILVENYEVQLDAILQSHDADYWAAHAAGEMKQFYGAAAFYKNEYGELAAGDPIINAAMRAYEQSLLFIRDSHNGYIPPAVIGYDPNNLTYYWDHLAEDMFKQYIKNGVVRKARRDEMGLAMKENGRLVLDKNPLTDNELDDLEIKRVMKLAKGFGIISMRLLEIFANSRGPGSDHPEFAARGFHSIPYESIARYMQPLVLHMTKWKQGNVIYNAFFKQLLDPHGTKSWNKADFETLRKSIVEGDAEKVKEIIGKDAERIIDMDNLNNFSGGFGPWSKWRIADSILKWSDRDREWLGGGMRLALSEVWAKEKVKKYLEDQGYDTDRLDHPKGWNRIKEEHLHDLTDINIHRGPVNIDLNLSQVFKGDYQQFIENHDVKDHAHGTALAQKLARAHNAHVWIQMVERNPLLVARHVETGRRGEAKVTLRTDIIQQILNINLLDSRFIDQATPTDDTRRDLQKVAVLEADVASIREKLINDVPPRGIRASDFTDVIPDGNDYTSPERIEDPDHPGTFLPPYTIKAAERRENAKKYWNLVHQKVTGDKGDMFAHPGDELKHTHKLLEEVGFFIPHGQNALNIEWNKVKNIDNILHHHEVLGTLVSKKWNWLAATDDASWRQMDLLNLGARQWIRRAGDLNSHAEGFQLQNQYLDNLLIPKAEMPNLVEHLAKIRDAFAGDDIAVGWKNGYNFAQATARLYENQWLGQTWLGDTFPGQMLGNSIMGRIYGRFHTNVWTANERRRWVDMLLENRIVPPNHIDPFGQRYPYNAHRLQRELNARDFDALIEIITLGVLGAMIITSLTALEQSMSEESGGGGGGGKGGRH